MIRALFLFHALFKNRVSVEKYLHLKFHLSDEYSASSDRCNSEVNFAEQSSRKYTGQESDFRKKAVNKGRS